MKKKVLVLLSVAVLLIFSIAFCQAESLTDNEAVFLDYFEAMWEEATVKPQLLTSEKFVLAFLPKRYQIQTEEKFSSEFYMERMDSLYLYNRSTQTFTEFNSYGSVNFERLDALISLARESTLGEYDWQQLFAEEGFSFNASAPERLFKAFQTMEDDYSLEEVEEDKLLEFISSMAASHVDQISEGKAELKNLLRTYVYPLGEGEGEADYLAFNAEYVILTLNTSEQGFLYCVADDTLTSSSDTVLDELSENCTMITAL